MKGLVYQTPLVQLVINLLITILETAGVLQRRVSSNLDCQANINRCCYIKISCDSYGRMKLNENS